MKDTRVMPPTEDSAVSGLPPHQSPDGRPSGMDSPTEEAPAKVHIGDKQPANKQGVPNPPHDLRTADVAATGLKLNWQMKNKNACNVTYYVIKYKPKEAKTWAEISGAFTNTYDVKDLSPFTDYEMAVLAVNSVGRGELSEPIFVTTRKEQTWEPDDSDITLDELKDAFRLFDADGAGYITTDIFKEILSEIEPEWTEDDLMEIICDIDIDGSGTIDFEEFVKIMIG